MVRLNVSRAAVAGVVLMLVGAALACNLQFGPSAPTPVATASASITFVAPAKNTTIAEGSMITLAVSASDSASGVAKVDFFLDDTLIGTQSADNAAGQQTFVARMDWIATGVQGHLLAAVAYRADGAKIGETGITIQVLKRPDGLPTAVVMLPSNTPGTSTNLPTPAATDNAIQPTTPVGNQVPTATLSSVFGGPTSPPVTIQIGVGTVPAVTDTPQGVVAVATTTPNVPAPILEVTFEKLNVRAGPGTEYTQIGEIPRGEKATVLGRNADRAWVFIQWREVRGWVVTNPSFSKITGDTTYLPLIGSGTPTPAPTIANPVAGNTPAPLTTPEVGGPTSAVTNGPDLVITKWLLVPSVPTAGRSFDVVVVVKNQGQADAGQALVVGVFQPGDVQAVMDIPPLKAGQEVTLRPMTVSVASAGQNLKASLIVDAKNEVDEGANESNNTVTFEYNVGQ